ncbi:MAG: hypothetical protein NTX65_15930 [Ignavibacteriales bacterium]|nr:hypothetical protein [Ignavibacteriales bacterium]
MKFFKWTLLILVFFKIEVSAQFSIDKFFNESFNRTYSAVKDSLSEKKIEEKESMGVKTLMYYDYFEPLSVGIGYMFKGDGLLMGRMISNGKEDEESANKLFNIFKKLLLEKFGSTYTDNSMLGVTMLSWIGNDQYSVMLTKKGDGAMMMLMKKKKK